MAETEFAARFASMLARDARCDGVFWTGVRTTGIYCLPSCPARSPATWARRSPAELPDLGSDPAA
ncbi:MAG: Ada metal-binding domain-containing protein [Thermoanaerobaculia bacterium]|nr:Ada metal-binding domain-containing protein [Thermoanaerobaculia bacterium]